jgi:hypothetical protein
MNTPKELAAIHEARMARAALVRAIAACEEAGFGSQVVQPLRDALENIEYSIREAQA